MPRTCAFRCSSDVIGTNMHSFPNYARFPERFKTWVTLVGGKLNTEADLKYYKKSKVCSIHFTDRDRNRFNRLNALAVPSLHLSGRNASIVQDVSESDSCCTETNDVRADNEERLSANKGLKISQVVIPTSSIMMTESAIADDVNPSVDTAIPPWAPHAVQKEHTYSIVSKEERAYTQTMSCCSKQVKPLRMKIKYLRSEVNRLRKQCETYKAKIAAFKRISYNTPVNEVVHNRKKLAQIVPVMQSHSKKKLVRTYSKFPPKGNQ